MPHVVVKLHPDRTEEQKTRLAEGITKAVIATAGSMESAVSVSIQEVQPQDWVETVYKPDILGHWDTVHKKPSYDPL
jgi:4-oxalocrotonate tautomerase